MKLEDLRVESESIDLDKYIEFRESIKNTMEHPEWLGDFTKEELAIMLNNGTVIYNYYKDDEMVSSMMMIPAREKDVIKFGLDIDYNDLIDYGPMMVNSKYRGNKLQLQMLKKLDEVSSKNYKYALGTIHPDNVYSINNLVKDGFVLKGTKEFKRGIRDIYLKEL